MALVETEFCLMNLFCNMCFHIYKEDKWDGSRNGGLKLFIVQDYKRGRRRRTVLYQHFEAWQIHSTKTD